MGVNLMLLNWHKQRRRYFGGKANFSIVKMTDSATATGDWSDNNNESDLEGDEEPLFADDLEDIPPLPPPMSPLSEQRGQSSYVSCCVVGYGDFMIGGEAALQPKSRISMLQPDKQSGRVKRNHSDCDT